jgi:hypothetical protein
VNDAKQLTVRRNGVRYRFFIWGLHSVVILRINGELFAVFI